MKNLVRLGHGGHRKRQGRFLVEGLREVRRALQCGWPVESLFFCEDLFKSPESYDLLHEAEERNIELIRMTVEPFTKSAYRQGADGLLAVAMQRHGSLDELRLTDPALVVVVESIEKPGNLGAIFRTADAAGADALVITDIVTDPFNPNCIRASQGAFFSLPFCCSDNASTVDFLERKDIQAVATSPDAEKILWDADLCRPSAIILGPEENGLSRDWLDMFESYKLPMRGITDSLNVASTASIALFEAVRQRSRRTH